MNHAFFPGPIKGEVTLTDGTVVDVTPDVVYMDDLDKVQEAAHLVSERYATEGHPAHIYTGVPFEHDAEGSLANFKSHRKSLENYLNGEGQ